MGFVTADNDSERDDLSVAEEEDDLCRQVIAHLQTVRPSSPPPRNSDDEALITLRDQIGDSHLEDVPALLAQMMQISAVSSSRGQSTAEPIGVRMPV